jgi:hypothetical protein
MFDDRGDQERAKLPAKLSARELLLDAGIHGSQTMDD